MFISEKLLIGGNKIIVSKFGYSIICRPYFDNVIFYVDINNLTIHIGCSDDDYKVLCNFITKLLNDGNNQERYICEYRIVTFFIKNTTINVFYTTDYRVIKNYYINNVYADVCGLMYYIDEILEINMKRIISFDRALIELRKN